MLGQKRKEQDQHDTKDNPSAKMARTEQDEPQSNKLQWTEGDAISVHQARSVAPESKAPLSSSKRKMDNQKEDKRPSNSKEKKPLVSSPEAYEVIEESEFATAKERQEPLVNPSPEEIEKAFILPKGIWTKAKDNREEDKKDHKEHVSKTKQSTRKDNFSNIRNLSLKELNEKMTTSLEELTKAYDVYCEAKAKNELYQQESKEERMKKRREEVMEIILNGSTFSIAQDKLEEDKINSKTHIDINNLARTTNRGGSNLLAWIHDESVTYAPSELTAHARIVTRCLVALGEKLEDLEDEELKGEKIPLRSLLDISPQPGSYAEGYSIPREVKYSILRKTGKKTLADLALAELRTLYDPSLVKDVEKRVATLAEEVKKSMPFEYEKKDKNKPLAALPLEALKATQKTVEKLLQKDNFKDLKPGRDNPLIMWYLCIICCSRYHVSLSPRKKTVTKKQKNLQTQKPPMVAPPLPVSAPAVTAPVSSVPSTPTPAAPVSSVPHSTPLQVAPSSGIVNSQRAHLAPEPCALVYLTEPQEKARAQTEGAQGPLKPRIGRPKTKQTNKPRHQPKRRPGPKEYGLAEAFKSEQRVAAEEAKEQAKAAAITPRVLPLDKRVITLTLEEHSTLRTEAKQNWDKIQEQQTKLDSMLAAPIDIRHSEQHQAAVQEQQQLLQALGPTEARTLVSASPLTASSTPAVTAPVSSVPSTPTPAAPVPHAPTSTPLQVAPEFMTTAALFSGIFSSLRVLLAPETRELVEAAAPVTPEFMTTVASFSGIFSSSQQKHALAEAPLKPPRGRPRAKQTDKPRQQR